MGAARWTHSATSLRSRRSIFRENRLNARLSQSSGKSLWRWLGFCLTTAVLFFSMMHPRGLEDAFACSADFSICTLFAFGKFVLQRNRCEVEVSSVDVPFYSLGCATIRVGFVKASKLRSKLQERVKKQLPLFNAVGHQGVAKYVRENCQEIHLRGLESVRRTISECSGSRSPNRGWQLCKEKPGGNRWLRFPPGR